MGLPGFVLLVGLGGGHGLWLSFVGAMGPFGPGVALSGLWVGGWGWGFSWAVPKVESSAGVQPAF